MIEAVTPLFEATSMPSVPGGGGGGGGAGRVAACGGVGANGSLVVIESGLGMCVDVCEAEVGLAPGMTLHAATAKASKTSMTSKPSRARLDLLAFVHG